MHELAIIDDLITAITERVGAARVFEVRLEVGRRAGVSVDALQFSFEVCARGTALEGAALSIEATEGDSLRLTGVEVERDVYDLRM